MSSNSVTDLTAALGAITPNPTTDSGTAPRENLTSREVAIGTSNTHKKGLSSFGRYNKQSLISKYLSRGRDATEVPKKGVNPHIDPRLNDGSVGPSSEDVDSPSMNPPNNPNVNKEGGQTKIIDFGNVFGTSIKLPKFSKRIPTNKASVSDTGNVSLTKAVRLMDDMHKDVFPSGEAVIDLTTAH
ncbi:hypothetical protein DFH28DRAFT_1121636 [Melampsora americana]|nr:hypothetical protein DFH28DRAFT_1121636 [Melampsora americana]